MTKLRQKRQLKKSLKNQKAAAGFNKLEDHAWDAVGKGDWKHSSVRDGGKSGSDYQERYIVKKAGAEALGGDLKPQKFYSSHKVSKDEKSSKDLVLSSVSGKGYMKKSNQKKGGEDTYKELSAGRVKRITNRIDKKIKKKHKTSKKK